MDVKISSNIWTDVYVFLGYHQHVPARIPLNAVTNPQLAILDYEHHSESLIQLVLKRGFVAERSRHSEKGRVGNLCSIYSARMM